MTEVGIPQGSSPAEDSATNAALAQVRQQRARLSRQMNEPDAARLVLGLLYLSRTAHPASARPGVPTWAWLVNQAANDRSVIGPDVRKCLIHWLPQTEAGDGSTMHDSIPAMPQGTDAPLRTIIRAISSVQRVGTLLDESLRDLSADQARGDRYFTPPDMARLIVGTVAPQDGNTVLDPVCGSGGLLVEAHRYVHEHVGLNPNIFLWGRDRHIQTSQVARMNLSLRGIKADIHPPRDSLAEAEADRYDIILANLPFNQRDWAPEDHITDPRWSEETSPKGSANSAWIQHVTHALADQGRAAFLMADNVAKSDQPATRRLREKLLWEDLVECVIALPPRVFGHTDATACLWVLNKDKRPRPGWDADRRGQVLFINARQAFETIAGSRARQLGDKHSNRILTTLAAWRRGTANDGADATGYTDEPGWSRSCSTKEVTDRNSNLMPTSWAMEPQDPEPDTRSRINQLKHELIEELNQTHDLEPQLLDALEEI